jgi:hypothetical protein
VLERTKITTLVAKYSYAFRAMPRTQAVTATSYPSTLRIPLCIYCALFALCTLAILILNQGHFIFSLDDPYIHLALSRNILHGHYGINTGEYAAPSSSILWPFLLVPFMLLPYADIFLLVINFALSVSSLVVIHKIVAHSFDHLSHVNRQTFITVTVSVLMLATNLVGLPFTGMEHSLQVLLALMVLRGLLQEHETGQAGWWLYAAIVLGPLVRYENLVLSGPALLYLCWRGHGKRALIYGSTLLAALVGFSLFLVAHGLGILPTSILAKSIGTQADSSLTRVALGLLENIIDQQGMLLLLGLVLLALRFKRPERSLAYVVCSAIGLHFVIGKFGWFSRYEIYIWVVAVLTLLYVYRIPLSARLEQLGSRRFCIRIAAVACICSGPYIATQLLTPLASNNMYEQQYQMSRFVSEYYRRPVAVNDLGLVAYHGGQYVLDLFGLGSRTALEMNETQTNAEWMNTLAEQHNVKLVMMYDSWFADQPQSWIPLGELHLGRRRSTASRETVTFYAVDQATARTALPLLQQFQTTLPDGVRFVFRR